MAVSAANGSGNGGSVATQKIASLTWEEETVQVETCGRSYWSFLQRARAIDNKQLGNVSAFVVDEGVDEEVCFFSCCVSCHAFYEEGGLMRKGERERQHQFSERLCLWRLTPVRE